jgi:hypothetical protein
MTATRLLACLWLVAALVAFGIPFAFFARGAMGADTLVTSLRELSQIFVPYVGVVLAFVYRDRGDGNAAVHAFRASTPVAAVALVTSAAWNLAVLVPLIRTALGSLPIETALQTAGDLADVLSWVVAPSLGYFFGGHRLKADTRTQQPA